MTTVEQRPLDRRSNTFARSVNVALGAWLFISAFIWPHSEVSRINSALCGALVVVFALSALRIPPMRWLNTAVGAWVVMGAALLPHAAVATVWNNMILGLLVVLVSVGGLSRALPQSPMP